MIEIVTMSPKGAVKTMRSVTSDPARAERTNRSSPNMITANNWWNMVNWEAVARRFTAR